MARSRFASLLLLAAVACFVGQLSNAFLPSPQAVARSEMQQAQGAVVAAGLAAASMPTPAFAARVEEEDEGFDLRILAVLALPLFAVSWALFNVWRVAFRQVVRIQDSEKGNPLWVAKDMDFCKDRSILQLWAGESLSAKWRGTRKGRASPFLCRLYSLRFLHPSLHIWQVNKQSPAYQKRSLDQTIIRAGWVFEVLVSDRFFSGPTL